MQFLKIEITTHGYVDMHMARTDVRCNVEISKHIFYQIYKYVLWA